MPASEDPLNPSEANFHQEDLNEDDVCDLLEWLLREKKGAIARVERLGVRRISRASLLAFSPSRNFTGTLVEWNHGGRRDAVMKRPRGERRRKFLPNPGEKIKMRRSDGEDSDGELSDGEIIDINPFYPEPVEKPSFLLDKNADRSKSKVVALNEGPNNDSTATSASTLPKLQPRDTTGYPLMVQTKVHNSHGRQQQDHPLQVPYLHSGHESDMTRVVHQTKEDLKASANVIEQPQPHVVVCHTPAYHVDNRTIQRTAPPTIASAPTGLNQASYTFEGPHTGSKQAVTNNTFKGDGVLGEEYSAFTISNQDAFLHNNNLTDMGLEEAAYTPTQPTPKPDDTAYYVATIPHAQAAGVYHDAPAAAASSFAGGMDGSVDSIHLQHNDLAMPAADDFLHTSFDDLVAWDGDA
ncbi:uncharacterized protein PgNI_09949 [Pyricularia grisea]|uniref:Uncharacterized protein n=1 Tax=Pyricularia grisea TaxID=148305 RepID=A0A6P8AR84_PYRGI|nr:uncharacterized protein PgNI_09949 [Pyricularia grisea]TLD04628.1 hypothetical protein PgNI_09949 [Pyricularia grisea]